MAGRIAGITIEIGGDTSNLQKSLKGVDSQLKTTQSNLKDINKLLKLNPSSVELLTQKQKNLKDAVAQTKDRLQQLKDAQNGVAKGTAEWDALQREIISTETDLKKAETELRNFGSVAAQQAKAAGQKMQEFGNKVTNVGKELSKISGAAAAALGGLAKIGVDAMHSADELATLSQKTGLSTDTLQRWSYAAELVDVDLNSMTRAMSKMKKGMGSGNKAFEDLGVSITNADGSLRDAESVFYDTLQALSGIENETERDVKAMEIFGKSADELAGIVDDGGAALQQYGQEAADAGLIMSEDMVKSLNEANDTMDKTKKNISMSLGQLGGTLIEAFGPAIEKVAGFIGTLTEKIRSLSPEQAEMIVKILAVVAAVGPIVMIIGKIITGVGALMSILPLLAGPFGIVLAVIAAVIAIGVLLYKNWDKIKEAAAVVAAFVVGAWESLKTGVTAAVDAVTTWVTTKWNTMKTAVQTATNALKTVVTTAWDSLKSKVQSVVDNIKDKVQNLIDKFNNAKNAIQNAISTIKGILSGSISFPHIRMPHFSISGSFSLDPPRVPHISVSWYKKAYQNPVMFTSPTVLPTAAGMKGFGDGSGAEIVMGLDKLREMVGGMGQEVDVNVYLMGDARQLFKVVKQENNVRTRATNYNALAVGG